MHLLLPDDRRLSLDFEPLLTLARDPAHYHIQEIVDQLNAGGHREMALTAAGGTVLEASRHGENSEVLPAGSVAVTVTNRPGRVTGSVTLKVALLSAPVVAGVEPR